MYDKANDNRRNNACQIADKAENTAGNAHGFDRSYIADSTPKNSRHTLSKKRNGHNSDNHCKGIGVICGIIDMEQMRPQTIGVLRAFDKKNRCATYNQTNVRPTIRRTALRHKE
mgnify:CR=1 FL=1